MTQRKKMMLFAGAGLAVAGGALILLLKPKNQRLGKSNMSRMPARIDADTTRASKGDRVLQHYRSKELPIEERIALLQDLTAKSVRDPAMRKLALQITSKCPARDGECETRAIYDWTRKNIRYTGDTSPHKLGRNGPVEAVDMFQKASFTVEAGGGDCDDHDVLNATLLILNGIDAQFRVTSPSKMGKNNYTHIYTMAGLPKGEPSKWIALDTTLPGDRYGFEVPYAKSLDVVA